MRVCRVSPCDTTQDEALLGGSVPVIEGDPVGHVLDGVPIEVDLELVHAFRVIARGRNLAEDRVANIDYEDCAHLPAKEIEVGDIEPDVLPR